MLILIVVIAFVIGMFFLIAAIALGGYIYNGMKKNSDLQKKCLKILIPSAVIWLLLTAVNAVLIIIYLYNNGGEILEFFTQLLQLFKKQP
ncbi:MAG: hypothetical protein LBQ89_04220 [Treponema sp.]|jgi:cytochrome bd-type quinol oxidase subunit 2|nr:hypothetical protein [Treponema sp.]